MDHVSEDRRSAIMASVGSKNTAPELIVRRILHALGYRFRLHRKDLPGKPDVVLPKYRTCLFIHGCFWHRHPNCKKSSLPKSNTSFWEKKFERNIHRDYEVTATLRSMGWNVVIIWECQTKSPALLAELLSNIVSNGEE